MTCAVRPHPHGGWTIARRVSPKSTAAVYHGQFPSADAAQRSALMRELARHEPPPPSKLDHLARALELMGRADRMLQRAAGHRARANLQRDVFSHRSPWDYWMKRAVNAHAAALRLIKWADNAKFAAVSTELK